MDLFVAGLGLKFYEEKQENQAENLGTIDDYIEQEVGKASSEISKEYQLIIENGNVNCKSSRNSLRKCLPKCCIIHFSP